MQKSFHYGFIIVACCCLMMGVNVGLTFSCAGIFYRPVSETLGVAPGVFGIYMAIMYVTSSLMLPFAGKLIERHSARRLFAGSSAVMGLIFLSMFFYNAVWEFYLAGALLGLTLAFLLYLSYPTMVNRWFHTKVGLMIGICCAASGIGGVLFNPIAGWMINEWGWRWAYGAFGLLILFVVTPLLLWLLRDYPADKGLKPYGFVEQEEKKMDKVDSAGVEYAKASKSPLFYGLIFFAFLIMGISTLNLFIPGFVSDNGFSLTQASFTASAVMVGVTVGKLALGWINDRNCMAGVWVTTGCGILGLAVMLAGVQTLFLIMAGAFLFGWAYAGVTVQTAMLTRTVFGSKDFARINSVVSIGLAAGGAIASAGWGLLSDATSTSFIFIVGIFCLLACLAIGVWALKAKPIA